jgi:UDP-perosamine 4-acetyltransferase
MEVLAPRVNANDNEAKLVVWHISAWQPVNPGDTICSIETTKATVDVETEVKGFFYPAVAEGETVKVGQVLAWVLPEKSEALLDKLRRSQETTDDGVIVSAKARALMDEHKLTVADFPSAATISAREVEVLIQSRGASATVVYADDIIASLAIDENSILVWGGGYQGAVVLDILAETQAYRPVVVIDQKLQQTEVYGVPVLRPDHLSRLYDRGLRKAHICIGKAADKLAVAHTLKVLGFSLVNVMHPSAVLSPRVSLGENVFIGPLVLVGPEVTISDLCQLNNGASIAHNTVLERSVAISDGARIGGIVHIGEATLVGIGTVVNSRVTVGSWCTIVESGTVVRADGTQVKAN